MREPGARLVFTHGRVVSPRRRALRARRPAATSTAGFDVFVQLVIAAISTAPSDSSKDLPPDVTAVWPVAFGLTRARSAAICARLAWYAAFEVRSGTRSCGRFGPARLGSTRA